MRPKLTTVVAASFLWPICGAQTAAAPAKLPSYDVSTVRPNTAGGGHVSISTNNDIFHAENVSFKDLLQDAFGIQRNLIFGIPAWAESARYDINAKVLDAEPHQLYLLTPEQRRDMYLGLYESRFGLKWHYETRIMPDYELVVAKDGPKFKPAAPNKGSDGVSQHNTDLTMTNMPMLGLVQNLSREVERPVVDKTGLTGKYDLHLKWSRQDSAAASDAGNPDAPPPIFTALQEQLGLKLQPGKDPVQVVVIDSLTPPTAN